ncbi:hypothetical protein [Propionivibrio sp.]
MNAAIRYLASDPDKFGVVAFDDPAGAVIFRHLEAERLSREYLKVNE